MNTTQTQTSRAIAHHTAKLVEAIELANNATLVVATDAADVIFVASRFAAEGIALATGQLVEHVESETYVVKVLTPRTNRPGCVAG